MESLPDVHKWSNLEQYLREKTYIPFCKMRQIWWCSLGVNIGREIYGKNELFERPVLILKIYDREMALVIPFTSKEYKDKDAILFDINGQVSYLLLSQIRTVSMKRFSRKIGRMPQEKFDEILKIYTESLKNSQSRLAPALDLAENPLETPPEGR